MIEIITEARLPWLEPISCCPKVVQSNALWFALCYSMWDSCLSIKFSRVIVTIEFDNYLVRDWVRGKKKLWRYSPVSVSKERSFDPPSNPFIMSNALASWSELEAPTATLVKAPGARSASGYGRRGKIPTAPFTPPSPLWYTWVCLAAH